MEHSPYLARDFSHVKAPKARHVDNAPYSLNTGRVSRPDSPPPFGRYSDGSPKPVEVYVNGVLRETRGATKQRATRADLERLKAKWR